MRIEIFNKKEFRNLIIYALVLLIFLSILKISSPFFQSDEHDKKEESLQLRENHVNELYKLNEYSLFQKKNQLKTKLSENIDPQNPNYKQFIDIVSNPVYNELSILILDPNKNLLAWNKEVKFSSDELDEINFDLLDEPLFYETDLVVYLLITDTINIANDPFYVISALPFEKKYTLENKYFNNINFTEKLKNIYSVYGTLSTDNNVENGYPLTNKNKNVIGSFVFADEVYHSNGSLSYFELISIALSITLFSFIVSFYKKKYLLPKNSGYDLLFFLISLVTLRTLIYLLNIPQIIFYGDITDPFKFASSFAGGIARSPLEFLLTNLFFFAGVVKLLNYVSSLSHERLRIKNNYILTALFFVITFFFFWILRGFYASVKSIIYDSSFSYFTISSIFPDWVTSIMIINLLLISWLLSVFLVAMLYFLFVLILPEKSENQLKRVLKGKLTYRKYILLGFFILFQFFGALFILIQKNPLTGIPANFAISTAIFLLAYSIFNKNVSRTFTYLVIGIVCSIYSIILLYYYNNTLEKEQLRTITRSIISPDINLVENAIEKTFESLNKTGVNKYPEEIQNYNAQAFIEWSKSILQKEGIYSGIYFYDTLMNRRGSFSVGLEKDFISPELLFDSSNIIIQRENTLTRLIKIGPIGNLGYAGIIAELPNIVTYDNFPQFLNAKADLYNTFFEPSDLNFVVIKDGRIIELAGHIYPNDNEIESLTKLNRNEFEKWSDLPIHNENYLSYTLYNSVTRNFIVSLVKEKPVSFYLFNFFKIFILHLILIFVLLIFIFIYKVKTIKYTFKTRLIIIFLIISIIPAITLALFNRQVVSKASEQLIKDDLSKRLMYLQNYLRALQRQNIDSDTILLLEKASKDLDISFVVYKKSDLIFNSKEQYTKSGLFSSKLDPEVYYGIEYLSYREILTKDKIESFNYSALYQRVEYGDDHIIIGVNDVFNRVSLPLNINEFDVFLFGIYSLAILIIVIISIFLADKISDPIRRLTRATQSISQGDLNIHVENKEKGELRDLINGFNHMSQELKKNELNIAELERENAWKEMARQVAHEIKNPLTPMKLALQQLVASYNEQKNFDKIFEKLSKTILNQIENLNQIASEFSRFARMPNFKLEIINIIPLIHDIVNLYSDNNTKVDLGTDIEEAFIEGDNSQFRRMLINFIRNSMQAGANKITIKLLRESANFVLLVEDNGKGIPEIYHEKIFEHNFTTKEKGMGIGLKISKRFIEGINGKLILDKSSSAGTVFRIILPEKNNA